MSLTRAFRPVLLGLLVVLAAACGDTRTSPAPGATDPSAAPTPTVVPGDPGSGGGTGGGTGSGGGSGGGGGVDPGDAAIVVPKPGTLNPAAVQLSGLTITAEGRHVSAQVTWWGGVEPCSVFDSTRIARDAGTVTITALEGSGVQGGDIACPAIAMLKTAILDLGEFDPGTYTFRVDPGDAPPITIEIR